MSKESLKLSSDAKFRNKQLPQRITNIEHADWNDEVGLEFENVYNLIGGSRGGSFIQIDYVEGTSIYTIPDTITADTEVIVDILTGKQATDPEGKVYEPVFGWDVSKGAEPLATIDPVAHTITFNGMPANSGNGLFRLNFPGGVPGEENPGTSTGTPVKTVKKAFTTQTYTLPNRAFDILMVDRNGQVLLHPETGMGNYTITDDGTNPQTINIGFTPATDDVFQVVYIPGNSTTTPPQEPQPAAPTVTVDDTANTVTITPVAGFPNPSDYEYEFIPA